MQHSDAKEETSIINVVSTNATNGDVIPDEAWEEWLRKLVVFLQKYEKKVDIITFLKQIEEKIRDCSRSYTAIWVIEMLFMTIEKNKQALGDQFANDVRTIKADWDTLFEPCKDVRKQLICGKCISFFYQTYAGAAAVISEEDAWKLEGDNSQKWMQISKMCQDAGLHNNEQYKTFLGQLMAEMVKY